MAVLALGYIGSAIGGAIGGTFLGMTAASIGWTVGTMVGSALFGPKAPDTQGPRLTDLSLTTSTRGRPIPKIYGSARIAGNIIWSSGINETVHSQEVGGKGGSSSTQTTYTYDASFAIGLCEGPIVGIGKIWANGILIYNKTNTATADEISASNNLDLAIYTGSETQLVDPLIEANQGIGNASANRSLAYVVFDQLQLVNYGNRIPNLTFEVVTEGSITAGKITSTNIDISEVINDIAVISSLTASDIDASTITDTTKGYSRSNRMSGRNALEPLMRAYNLYATESDDKIKFLKYDGSIAETVVEDQLAASEGISDNDRVTITRGEEVNLPRRVAIEYQNQNDNYQTNVQHAQRITD